MAIIVDRVTEKVMSLVNEQIGRTFTIGSNWSWIRVGILYEFFSSSVAHSSLPSPQFAVGLTCGTGSLYADSTLRHFIGAKTNSSANYGQYGIGLNHYVDISTSKGLYFTEKTGSTEISSSAFALGLAGFSTGSSRNRSMIFIDYIKSSSDPGVWSYALFGKNGQDGNIFAIDTPPVDFYFSMSVETCSMNKYQRLTGTFPVSESFRGMLDSVNISTNLTQSVEISDVAVYRFR
jgi:hypothetical protein